MVNLVEAIKRLIWIIDQTNKRLDRLQEVLEKHGMVDVADMGGSTLHSERELVGGQPSEE